MMHRKHLIKALGLSVLVIVGVMAVSASAAQAKYQLLLDGASVPSLHLQLQGLAGYMKIESGLKVECTGGTGLAFGEKKEEDKKVTGSASATFTGCFWAGSETTCQIVNEAEEPGVIDASGNGEVVMEGEEYRVTATSENFTTIYTEDLGGCNVPPEEVVSGTGSALILNALENTKVKLAHLRADSLKYGNSKVLELVGEVHLTDLDPTKTFGIHLVP